MANESIKKAFQRFWEHTLNKIDDKADRTDLETLSSKVDEIENAGNIQSDWNQSDEAAVDYVKNRTHYTEIAETSSNILEWDSNTEGLVTVEPFPGAVMYKVSDIVLESSDFINAIVTSIQDNGAEITEILTEDKIMGNETVFVFGELGGIAVAKEDNAEYDGVVLPEAGIYFLKLDQFITVTKLEITSGATPFTTISEVVHKLDAKYLPDTEINKPKNYIMLIDQINGYKYAIEMRNGNLVSTCTISNIQVTTMPDKVVYTEGDYFDPTGMVVTATTHDGYTYNIIDYTYTNGPLVAGENTIEISYTKYNDTYTTTVDVAAVNMEVELIDFDYEVNEDGTYTITGWKQTLHGEPSTELEIPNYSVIKL